MAHDHLQSKTPRSNEFARDVAGLDVFEGALRELRAPSRAVTAQAIREMIRTSRAGAETARAQARQHEAELSDAFNQFLVLHQGTPAFELKAEQGRLLRLAESSTGEDDKGDADHV